MSLITDPELDSSYKVVETYSCTLNQVDIRGNHNKFYIIQLVEKNGSYYVFSRWGRVGNSGQQSLKSMSNKDAAIREFCRLFKTKTKNIWGEKFVKKDGQYMLLEMEQPEEESSSSDTEDDDSSSSDAEKDDPVVSMILGEISNKSMMKQTLISLNIDPKKMPLGKISSKMIKKARKILKKIENSIEEDEDTTDLSSAFWTIVPYATRTHRPPPVLSTLEEIDNCYDMLDTLENMSVATKIVKEKGSKSSVSSFLEEIDIDMQSIDHDSEEYAMIEEYISSIVCPTHGYTLTLEEAVSLDKQSLTTEDEDKAFSRMKNHRLLVHGTRTANVVGIMKEGIRIPLPSQVSNGSTLGLGAYFADCPSKSFNYTYSQSGQVGYVFLCEVALGKMHKVQQYNDSQLRDPCGSRMAEGTSCPSNWTDVGDYYVPEGPLIKSNVTNGSFLYNEYVIYDANRYRFRYLLKLRRS